ncbi:MAG: hypothetical protein KAJ14_01095, partial [Candidatus Omnitrophica bacterium]|nr:hypothetical protein [Candidatus Omnitrophota bacterium]
TILRFGVFPEGQGLGTIFYQMLEKEVILKDNYKRVKLVPDQIEGIYGPVLIPNVIRFWEKQGFKGDSHLMVKDLVDSVLIGDSSRGKTDGGSVLENVDGLIDCINPRIGVFVYMCLDDEFSVSAKVAEERFFVIRSNMQNYFNVLYGNLGEIFRKNLNQVDRTQDGGREDKEQEGSLSINALSRFVDIGEKFTDLIAKLGLNKAGPFNNLKNYYDRMSPITIPQLLIFRYLNNKIFNIIHLNKNSFAASHAYRQASHGKVFSLGTAGLGVLLNRIAGALYLSPRGWGVSASSIETVVREDGGQIIKGKIDILNKPENFKLKIFELGYYLINKKDGFDYGQVLFHFWNDDVTILRFGV